VPGAALRAMRSTVFAKSLRRLEAFTWFVARCAHRLRDVVHVHEHARQRAGVDAARIAALVLAQHRLELGAGRAIKYSNQPFVCSLAFRMASGRVACTTESRWDCTAGDAWSALQHPCNSYPDEVPTLPLTARSLIASTLFVLPFKCPPGRGAHSRRRHALPSGGGRSKRSRI